MIDGTGALELLCDEDFSTDSTRGWFGCVVDRVVLVVTVVVAMLTINRNRVVKSYMMEKYRGAESYIKGRKHLLRVKRRELRC